jgi:hypothetical protein
VLENAQIPLWLGMFPPAIETLIGWMKKLDKTPDQVFPLDYRSDAPILGGEVKGTLQGFSFLNNGKVDIFPL